MNEEQRIDAATSMFDGWAEGDFSGGRDLFSSDMTVTWSEPPSDIVARGSEVPDALRKLLAQWEDFRAEAEHVEAMGDSAVMVSAHQWASGKGSGVDVDAPVWIVFVFEGDLITGLHWHFSREQALREAGLA